MKIWIEHILSKSLDKNNADVSMRSVSIIQRSNYNPVLFLEITE